MAVRTTFANHIYMYGNKLYKQMVGGPLGLRLTGVVAHIVMDHWAKLFLSTLASNDIKVFLFKKYVDDVNLALSLARPGLHCERDPEGTYRLPWSKERETQDLKEKTRPDIAKERTICLIRK